MKHLIDLILKFIRGLFGGQTAAADCLVSDLEIPGEQNALLSESDIPQEFSAQAARPMVTIRSNLTRAHIYTAQDMAATPLLVTKGGATYDLLETTPQDVDGFRWFKVRVGQKEGWIRSELVTLNAESSQLDGITAADIPDPAPPPRTPPAQRFTMPATAKLTQGYSENHQGIDLGTPLKTPIRAAADGLVIRAVTCQNCSDSKPNIFPCGSTIYQNPAWGYGYGNFVVIRHEYAMMPAELRSQMDRLRLQNGFVYVLYAHFSRLNVRVGQRVSAGHVLGQTGNHGCSTGPHLHFEVRVGTVDMVDNVWSQQRPLNPNLMFNT